MRRRLVPIILGLVISGISSAYLLMVYLAFTYAYRRYDAVGTGDVCLGVWGLNIPALGTAIPLLVVFLVFLLLLLRGLLSKS